MTLQFSDLSVRQPQPSNLDDVNPLSFAGGVYRRFAKRFVDIFLVVISLPVVLPFIGIMLLLAAMDGRSPVYSQLRVGRGNKPFRLWKIRTMVPDADRILEEYLAENPEARAEWDRTQKLRDDPRVTRVGRILRKTSMDELPQLLNVLTGSMSLVGPRPMMLDQAPYYYGSSYARLRPGITGPWQVSDRNESIFVARVAFDDSYYKTLSLTTDLTLLVRTVGVVVRGTGY